MKYHTLKWFQNRRGKTIYRKPRRRVDGEMCCNLCEQTIIKVYPLQKRIPDHAQDLFDYQNQLKIAYYDKPIA